MPPRQKTYADQHCLCAALPVAQGVPLGIDEAGRGCLAGPVVACAVLLPDPCPITGLADSKSLGEGKRQTLAVAIKAHAIAWGLGLVWQRDIDRLNILQATLVAMSRAAASLALRHARQKGPLPSCFLHIDGNKTIPRHVLQAHWPSPSLPQQVTLVRGDALDASISAASIVAKTFRDRLMISLHKRWPMYNFARHKGYGTSEHLAALAAHGPCPLHRYSFAGVMPDKAEMASEAGVRKTGRRGGQQQSKQGKQGKQGSLL